MYLAIVEVDTEDVKWLGYSKTKTFGFDNCIHVETTELPESNPGWLAVEEKMKSKLSCLRVPSSESRMQPQSLAACSIGAVTT